MGKVWDSNGQNMQEPSQALFDDGYDEDAIPTSANFNWLLNNLTAFRIPVGAMTGYTAAYTSLDVDSGFLPMNGSTVAKSSVTTATYHDDRYQDLYVFMWDNIVGLTVSGGKGANALADWNAGKTITTPNTEECVIAGATTVAPPAGQTNPFYAQAGTIIGSNTHTLTEAELPTITPTINDPGHTHPYNDYEQATKIGSSDTTRDQQLAGTTDICNNRDYY